MARAVQRPAARRDFIIHYAYLLEHAGPAVAKRFRKAVEDAYNKLAERPGRDHRASFARQSTRMSARGRFKASGITLSPTVPAAQVSRWSA